MYNCQLSSNQMHQSNYVTHKWLVKASHFYYYVSGAKCALTKCPNDKPICKNHAAFAFHCLKSVTIFRSPSAGNLLGSQHWRHYHFQSNFVGQQQAFDANQKATKHVLIHENRLKDQKQLTNDKSYTVEELGMWPIATIDARLAMLGNFEFICERSNAELFICSKFLDVTAQC